MTVPASSNEAAAGTVPAPADAELAVARLGEMSPDLRGCAVFDAGGAVLAATGSAADWSAELLTVADTAGGRPAAHVHVATEDGEAFAVRHADLAMLVVTERFTLSSLMVFDMRTILRDLAAGTGIPDRRKPLPRDLAAEEEEET